MKFFNRFVVVALIISLFLNYMVFSKVSEMENRILSITNTQQQMFSSINNQTNHIRNVMNDFEKEQRWMSPIKMNVDLSEDSLEESTLHFEWQIKELDNNADVTFHYSFGDSSDSFQSLPAQKIDKGLFNVSIPHKVDLEPQWEISYHSNESRERGVIESVEAKEMMENKHSKLTYYVSSSKNDMVKSGDIHTTSLAGYGAKVYGMIHTSIHVSEDKTNINISQHYPNSNSPYIEEAKLLMYKNKELLLEEKLEKEPDEPANEPVNFMSYSTKETEFTKLIIKVTYSDGETFEETIY